MKESEILCDSLFEVLYFDIQKIFRLYRATSKKLIEYLFRLYLIRKFRIPPTNTTIENFDLVAILIFFNKKEQPSIKIPTGFLWLVFGLTYGAHYNALVFLFYFMKSLFLFFIEDKRLHVIDHFLKIML